MPQLERQQSVLELLKGLRGLEPLKQLFWSELNYQRVNQPLSRRGWTDTTAKALAEDPILFAGGGDGNGFHVIYSRLASEKLLLGLERPVVSRLLNDHPYTLFVFSNASQDRWHFLNVKYDENNDNRRLFRRITLGKEERLRTASERISLLNLEAISPDLFGISALAIQEHHDEAFDVEAVTTLFYQKFAELFDELRTDLLKATPHLENEGRIVTQDLMNRLLFLYFIQKKGWLDGNLYYLVERFDKTARAERKETNYYTKTLLPLFSALSQSDAPRADLGKVPFLNGGLFDLDLPMEARLKISNGIFARLFDELFEHYNFTVREDTPLDQEVAVDPEMLGKVFEELVLEQEQGKDARRGSGSYYTRRVVTNFKARDALRLYLLDESFWPAEMWGDAPKQKGLAIDLSASGGSLESFAHRAARHTTRDRVDKYLKTRDPSQLDIPLARHLRGLLKKVKVCDPACGSGAYIVEMLHAISELWRQLSDILNEKCLPEDKLRQQIISENLYGADIQKTAVKICELRLWLSLVVDKELPAGEMPPPLPNLSYRIRVGDSLRSEFAGIVFSPHSLVLNEKTRKRVEELNQKRAQYFSTNHEQRKRKLSDEVDELELALFEGEIDDKIKQLKAFAAINDDAKDEIMRLQTARQNLRDPKKPKPFVWHIHFSEIFSEGRSGFDIMLANPPYGLKEENHPPEDFKLQSKDSYGLFAVRAIDLLREGGIFSFIMSDTWQTIKSHKPLRRRLLDSASVRHLLMMPTWIFGATVNTSILVLRKRAENSSAAVQERRQSVILAADLSRVPKDELLLQVGLDCLHEPQSQRPRDEEMAFYEYPQELIANPNHPNPPNEKKAYDGNPFFVGRPSLYRFLSYPKGFVRIDSLAEVKQGLATADNHYYLRKSPDARGSYEVVNPNLVLSESQITALTEDEKKNGLDPARYNERHLLPYDKGEESDTDEGWLPNYFIPTGYFIDWSRKAVLRLKKATVADCKRRRNKDAPPNEHETIQPKDENKIASRFQNPEWYFKQGMTFSRTGIYAPTFRLASGTVFDSKSDGLFPHDFDSYALLGILNSIVARYLMKVFLCHTVQAEGDALLELPIPLCDLNAQAKLRSHVSQIVAKQKRNPRYDYMSREQVELDALVYKLYGLSKEEVTEVETWYARRYPKLAAAARRKAAKVL